MRKIIAGFGGLAACCFIILGCGTVDTRSTVEQLTNARVAVEAAEKMDAKTYAPGEMRHAQDALAIARDAYANEAFERSFNFSKEATIYALVASARTEQKKSRKKLTDLKGQLDKVKARIETYMNSSSEIAPVSATPAVRAPMVVSPQPTVLPATQEGTQP